jgi:XTP/dITP diphosphohydrolase
MYRLIVATHNRNKLAELAAACADELVLEPLPTEARKAVEGTASLEENAILKAVTAVEDVGEAALADDTGFFVDALDGRPGVLAARFDGLASDGDRRKRVIELMRDVPESKRTAHYETVLCLAFPDGLYVTSRGLVFGSVPLAETGQNGFGYDAVFAPTEGGGSTFAQMPQDEKNNLSHRGRAMRAMMAEHNDLMAQRLSQAVAQISESHG